MKRVLWFTGVSLALATIGLVIYLLHLPMQGLRGDIRVALQEDGATIFGLGLMSGKDCRASQDPLCSNFANTEVIYMGGLVPCGEDCNVTDQKPVRTLDSTLTWQLARNEAVILFGPPPPSDTHFGIQLTSYERPMTALSAPDRYQAPAPGEKIPAPSAAGRIVVDASIGDTLNNHTLRRAADPYDPDAELFVLIITGNPQLAARITAALENAGVAMAAINTIGIPDSFVFSDETTPGVADSFRLVGRVARPFDEAAVRRYLRPNTSTLWRVTYPRDTIAGGGYPPPTYRSRETGSPELDASARREFEALKQWVIGQHGEPRAIVPAVARHYNNTSCIESGTYCWGNNNDALYVDIKQPGAAGLAEFDLNAPTSKIVIVGVDHHRLGFADFWNFAWFDRDSGANVGSFGMQDLRGKRFQLPADAPAVDGGFAVTIRSQCGDGEPYCIPPGLGPAASRILNIVHRIYVNPRTGTGPSAAEITLPVIFAY